mmetsp:Transcript_46314/g.91167  ORF Transcript_46314/g.91167 Transcript_46314/m.91167 type:complete len:358 (+) Transcript_46314:416-1489(+)
MNMFIQEGIYETNFPKCQGLVYLYNKDDLSLVQTISLPPPLKEGWGLTHDDRGNFFFTDGSATLFKLKLNQFSLQITEQVLVRDAAGNPVDMLNECEWIEGYVWINKWQTNTILIVDPGTGEIVAKLDMSELDKSVQKAGSYCSESRGAVLNGIAYNQLSNTIFIAGKLWGTIFEINVPGFPRKAPPSLAAVPSFNPTAQPTVVPTVAPSRVRTQPPTDQSLAGDSDPRCSSWVHAPELYCRSNTYVRENCPVGCSTDVDQNCSVWAAQGFCSTNTYVQTHCLSSCETRDFDEICKPLTSLCAAHEWLVPLCPATCANFFKARLGLQDADERCSKWRSYCGSNAYVSSNCLLTCITP